MKLPPVVFAALADIVSAQVDDPANGIKSTTTDVEDVPVDNDCQTLCNGLVNDPDTEIEMPSTGEWYTAACSDTCKISVKPSVCWVGCQVALCQVNFDGARDLPFKGEVKPPGQTTKDFKGGDC